MKFTLLAFALTATAVGAQTTPRSAADSAKAFSLDLPAAADATSTPAEAPRLPAANPDAPAAQAAATGMIMSYTLDTPIAQLVADPRAKAVLDKDMPGLSDDSNLPKFQSYSLRQFQPMTGGQLSTALLEKTGADLAALGAAPSVYTPPPLPTANQGNRHFDSGR